MSVVRTEQVTREQCQFVTEQECLPLEKEKCKKFPETLCDIVNVTKSQQQCYELEEIQVRFNKYCNKD